MQSLAAGWPDVTVASLWCFSYHRTADEEELMTDVKIRVYKGGESAPETTVTIPGKMIDVASRLIPKRASAALRDEGIDIAEISELAKNPDVQGTLVEIENHKKGERVVISLDQRETG
jgi:hypothetical protein